MVPKLTSSRAALRQEIGAILLTDSDLEAFCGDYFPNVAARFANGQDRVAKVSLLLALEDEEAIRAALQKYSPKIFPAAPGPDRSTKFVMPSRKTLLDKSQNLLSANEAGFERAVDVTLGIQQVPQHVQAQQLPHGGTCTPSVRRIGDAGIKACSSACGN